MSVYLCVCLIHMSSCIIYLSVIHMSQCVTYLSPICYSVSPICHPHVTMCLLSSSMHDLYMCIRIYCPRVISMCTPAALLYTSWEHTLCKVTKKEDSIVNKVTAASLTGVTFKCTAGVRLMATGGVLGAALSGLYFTASYLLKGSRGKTFYATY